MTEISNRTGSSVLRAVMTGAVVLLVGASLATTREFWSVDGCLDSGGAWDRQAQRCVRDGSVPAIPPAYPVWVFFAFAAASIGVLLAACLSLWETITRRWASARRLGLFSVVGSFAIFLVSMRLAMTAPALDSAVLDASAYRLGKVIS